MNEFLMWLFIIPLMGAMTTIFWRTTIYTRGAIFRPVGRILDYWVMKACLPTATFWDKVLRFIAYPLGRCIFCTGFHITYNIFFLFSWFFGLEIHFIWLIFMLPFQNFLLIIIDKYLLSNNESQQKDDWEYMTNPGKFFDIKQRCKQLSILTKEEEDILDQCKGNTN